jgi:hypothetical protein
MGLLPSSKLLCDALHRASPDPERSGDLQDTHTLRKLLSHFPFDVDLRPAELHALATARSAGCAELSRNDLHLDSLPPLFGQRAGVPYGCGMGSPYGGKLCPSS